MSQRDHLQCPQCGGKNACQAGQANNNCWCGKVALSNEQLQTIANKFSNQSCLCQKCLQSFSRNAGKPC